LVKTVDQCHDHSVFKLIARVASNERLNRKEGIMKARNCCKTMQAELTAWKANVYDIVRRMEELPGGEKERIRPNIEDLHMLISEMDDRIEYVRDNCTPETGINDIKTEREDFDKHLATLRIKTDEAMRGLGGGDFGG
jgi:SMC interacting uncharacterized protein involved in chromosome segregation